MPARGSPGDPLPSSVPAARAERPESGPGVARDRAVSAGPGGESGTFSRSQPLVSAGRRNEPRGRDFSVTELEIADGELSPRYEPIERPAAICF